ncbi:MAG: GspH/FimT family pseudopilin [Betaproteobacteria bacterium]|nr:GspH/FimT family pseudopilin [Betaproteobacteria bacterium]
MMRIKQDQRGLTMIELMIGLTIFTMLLLLGAPGFSAWIQSSHIRNAAEAIQNGLTLARAEAVRRNQTVIFQLVDTLTSSCVVSTSGGNWVVSRGNAAGACDVTPSETVLPLTIQKRSTNEGSPNAVVGAAQGTVIFNGLGRATNLAVSPTTINITNPSGGTCAVASGRMRCLRVDVTTGGQVRVCDPALSVPDTRAC